MRAVIIAGVAMFVLIVFVVGTMLPDTTEASFFNFLASTAEASKRAAIENSPEVAEYKREIADLRAELEQTRIIAARACPDHGTFGKILANVWPW